MIVNRVDVEKFKETVEKARKDPAPARKQWKSRANGELAKQVPSLNQR